MATEFFEAGQEVYEMLWSVLDGYYPLVATIEPKLNIDIRMAVSDKGGPAVKHHGHAAVATIELIKPKEKSRTKLDLRVTIDRESWLYMDGDERRAVLHHETAHIAPQHEKDGKTLKIDAYGRPKLKLRLDDWMLSGFYETARIFGNKASEVQGLAAVRERLNQRDFPFVAEKPDQSAVAARVEDIERDEGEGPVVREAFAALLSVGHTEQQARAAIDRVIETGTRPKSASELIEMVYAANVVAGPVPAEPSAVPSSVSFSGADFDEIAKAGKALRKKAGMSAKT